MTFIALTNQTRLTKPNHQNHQRIENAPQNPHTNPLKWPILLLNPDDEDILFLIVRIYSPTRAASEEILLLYISYFLYYYRLLPFLYIVLRGISKIFIKIYSGVCY